MKVRVEVLRAALGALLDHAEDVHGDEIDVDADLYWFVPRDTVNDPTSAPGELTLGSLEDDWSAMGAIAEGTKEPIGHALVWAAGVLRAVGDRTA